MKNTYPEDLTKLTLNNIEIIEDSLEVIKIIESEILKNLNRYVESYANKNNLKGSFKELIDNQEGSFWDKTWNFAENQWIAWFYFTRTKNNDSDRIIFSLLGCKGARIAIKFYLQLGHFGKSVNQLSGIIKSFYYKNEKLKERGFYINQEDKTTIDIDFTITKEEALNSYLYKKHSFKELDNALDNIVQSLDIFNELIESLKK